MRHNFRTPFTFYLHLFDKGGRTINNLESDWTFDINTMGYSPTFRASKVGQSYTNCTLENGIIRIVVNSSTFNCGPLMGKMTVNVDSPVEKKTIVGTGDLGIEMYLGTEELPTDYNVNLRLPFIADIDKDKINELRAEIDALKQADREFNDKLADIETNGAGGCDCDCPEEATEDDIVGVINSEASPADIEAVINARQSKID